MERKPDCLRDCRAVCCTRSVFIDLSPEEAEFLREGGTALRLGKYGYIKDGECTFVVDDKCSAYDNRPQVCRGFLPGSKDCLRYRAEYPDGVVNLTAEDVFFQDWYFGLDE